MLFDARGIASFWTPRRPRTCGEACERRGGAVRRSPTRRAAAVVGLAAPSSAASPSASASAPLPTSTTFSPNRHFSKGTL